jgi:hypothetical protein
MEKFAVGMVLLVLLVPLCAQNPNQYPPGPVPQPGASPPGTYPGQYPPGQGPGTGGISIPKRKGKKQNENAPPTFSQDGKTVSNDGKKLVIGTNDGRLIWFALTPKTKFTRSGNDIEASAVVPRTAVQVDASADEESFLTATHVDLLKDATKDTSPSAAASEPPDRVRPSSLGDAPVDAPDRPILRRGKPKSADSDETDSAAVPKALPTKKESSSGDFTIDSDSDQVKLVRTGDDLIDRTKEWTTTFMNGLPNYVCQQSTTRYMEQSRSSGWDALDVVTAKVVYEDGKEDYREITVGGKRTNKSMMELGGSTSTGEFASTLRSLFSDSSHGQFKLNQSTRLREVPASIYNFKVAMPNSDWTISSGSQTLRPAYSGGVWIEKGTGQVRRIEMQADNIPKNFPLDSMEWTVDYEEISLGAAKFLLPVHAENLACWRGTSICTKNATDFRDYHKFSGESTITFGK